MVVYMWVAPKTFMSPTITSCAICCTRLGFWFMAPFPIMHLKSQGCAHHLGSFMLAWLLELLLVLGTFSHQLKSWCGKKPDPEMVCFVIAAVFEWYSASFPLALQCFYTAKYNKWRIRRRKWEHATIIAWERSRAGTPAWPSSCSPHGTNALVAPQQL